MPVGSAEVPTTRGPVSYEHEGFTVRSNSGTVADLQHDLGVESQPDQITPAQTPVDADDDGPEASPDPALKSKEINKRIGKATYEREEANRLADAAKEDARLAREELARVKSERDRPIEREEPRRTDDEQTRYDAWKRGDDPSDPKPQVGHFEDHDAYLDARDAHTERRIERKQARAQQEQQHQERQYAVREAATKFQTRMDAEGAKDPAFKELLTRVQIPQGPILDVFLSTDIPEAMARHLDAHPEELRAMIAMRPGHQLAAIKKLEGRLEALHELQSKAAPTGSAAIAKPTTKAHPPINPVVGSHVAASDEPPGDDASDDEYYAYYDRNGNPRKR